MKHTPTIKGLKVPRIFLFTMGILHGRIMKSAGLDPDTGYIRSSYITGKLEALNDLCARQVKQMENELKAVWAEADGLLLAMDAARPDPENAPGANPRELARATAKKQQFAAQNTQRLEQLSAIHSKIRSREVNFWASLDSVASILKSNFSTYGHGVLLSSVSGDQLPPMTYEEHFAPYERAHNNTRRQLQRLLKEA